jgi:hypothetical protein
MGKINSSYFNVVQKADICGCTEAALLSRFRLQAVCEYTITNK